VYDNHPLFCKIPFGARKDDNSNGRADQSQASHDDKMGFGQSEKWSTASQKKKTHWDPKTTGRRADAAESRRPNCPATFASSGHPAKAGEGKQGRAFVVRI
jgi:hypothetical protein